MTRYWRQQLIKHWQLILLAIQFFTRLPVSCSFRFTPEKLNQANRYFALVGLLIGAILALSYSLFSAWFSPSVSVLLVLIESALLTGAFHQDGLADMADGIGGGLTPERRLTIMKDSRIGTYGAITLCLSTLLQWQLLVELANHGLITFTLLLGHSLSRALSSSLIFDLPYVSDTELSKSKPLANKQSLVELKTNLATALVPLLLVVHLANFFWLVVLLIFVLMAFRYWFSRWLDRRLGGFTGDCLGAAQQISELLIYLVLLVWHKGAA